MESKNRLISFPRTFQVIEKLDAKIAREEKDNIVYFCPYCYDKEVASGVPDPKPDTHGKLYVTKDGNSGICFRCNTVVFHEKAIEDAFSELSSALQLGSEYQKFDTSELQELNLDGYADASENETAMKWIMARNPFLTKEYVKMINLRYYKQEFETIDHFVVIKEGIVSPMYWDGKIRSFQIRYFTNDHHKRFYTKNGIRLLYIPFKIDVYQEITLCEGPFSAQACILMGFPNVVAICGKSLSAFQLNQIRNLMPHTINFCLDDYICNGDVARGLKKKIPTIESFRFFNFENHVDRNTNRYLDPEEFLVKFQNFNYYEQQLARISNGRIRN